MKTHRLNIRKKKTRKQKGGSISVKEWPLINKTCNTYTTDNINANNCYRELKTSAENPYYLSDKINGYTNNGFYKGWGYEIKPKNVKYIVVKNSKEISDAVLYCKDNNKKLIVKNTGHDYIGRSYPNDDSVIIWTHKMNNIIWKSKKYIIDKNGVKKKIEFANEFKKNCKKEK